MSGCPLGSCEPDVPPEEAAVALHEFVIKVPDRARAQRVHETAAVAARIIDEDWTATLVSMTVHVPR